MTLTTWNIELEGKTHTVEVERHGWRPRHCVRVDGSEIFSGNVPVEFGRHISFELAGRVGTVEINVPGRLAYEYALTFDGQTIPIQSGPQRTTLLRG